MSYQSVASATSGLVAGWMLNDTTGTTLADFSGNSLPLTLGTQGALGGTAIIPECTQSLTASGGGTGVVATHVNATAFQLTTGVTFCGWIKMGTPASTGWIGGRNNNWQLRQLGSSGLLEAAVWVGGTAKTVPGRTNIATGRVAFVALTFDANDILLVVNGNIEGRLTAPGSITTTSDDLNVLCGSDGNPFSGTGQGFAVFNRALSLGELRHLLRAGDSTHTIESTTTATFFDQVCNGNPAVAAAAQTRYCGFCGGLMQANERGAIAAHDSFHPTCHAYSLRTPTLLGSGATLANFGTQAIHLIEEFVNSASKRTTPDKTIYFDTQFEGLATNAWISTAGVGTAAAIMHRYVPGKRSPWNALVRQIVGNLLSLQLPTGSFAASGADANGFVQNELGMMVLLTKNSVEKTTWNTWRDAFLRSCYFELNGSPVRTSVGVTQAITNGASDAGYYINGNRNLQIALCFYLAYLITGDSYWDTQFEAELSFTIAPPAGAFGSGPGGSASGFGLYDGSTSTLIPEANLTNGTYTIGSNGEAFLAESNGSDTPGLDWDYLQLQLDFAHRLYLLSGDSRIALLMSLFWNMMQPNINYTTLAYTISHGTRHPSPGGGNGYTGGQTGVVSLLTTAPITLFYKLGRSDITTATIASMWTNTTGGLEVEYRTQGVTQGSVAYYRGLGAQPGAVLMAQSDWPGLPVAGGS